MEDLKCSYDFSIPDYREEFVCQLAGLDIQVKPPEFKPSTVEPGNVEAAHIVN